MKIFMPDDATIAAAEACRPFELPRTFTKMVQTEFMIYDVPPEWGEMVAAHSAGSASVLFFKAEDGTLRRVLISSATLGAGPLICNLSAVLRRG